MQQATTTAEPRLCGFIRKIKASQGFGFIQTDAGVEAFVHIKQVEEKHKFLVGAYVEFTLVPSVDGKLPRAVSVKVLS